VSAQTTFSDWDTSAPLTELTEAERDAYVAVERGDYGVREFARETERSPGTVGNLLRRARAKMGGSE